MRKVVVSFLCLLVGLVFASPAWTQDNTDPRLWGVWKASGDLGFDSFVLFTPNGSWGYQYIEGITYGQYSADGNTVTYFGTSEYADIVHFTENHSYEVNGNRLRIYDDYNGYMDYVLFEQFTGFGFIHCPSSVKSNMFVGAYGHVTYTDGTPSRLRQTPSISGTVVDQLPEGYMFLVVGDPVCSDGYTWWPINTRPFNPGTNAYNGSISGWIAEGEDNVAYIEPVGWIDTTLISGSGSGTATSSAINRFESKNGVQIYAPGEYPYAQELTQALVDGSAVDAAVNVYGLVGSSYEVVKDVNLGGNPVQLICMTDSVDQLTSGHGNEDLHYICLVFDVAKSAIAGEPIMIGITLTLEILTHPETYIDPWLDKVNAWVDTHPLLRFTCWLSSNFCFN